MAKEYESNDSRRDKSEEDKKPDDDFLLTPLELTSGSDDSGVLDLDLEDDWLLTPLEETSSGNESGVLNLGSDNDLDKKDLLDSDDDFLLTPLEEALDGDDPKVLDLGSDLPQDETGELDLTTLFGQEDTKINPDLSIDSNLGGNSNYAGLFNTRRPYHPINLSGQKLEVSKLEVQANFPELPKELTNRIEVANGESIVVYEGRFYDIEKVFTRRDIEHLSILGKVNLKRTDLRKERKEQKADITVFTPKYAEVEIPENIWCIDLSERKILYQGFSERYSRRLSAEALNQGIWVYDDLLRAVFSPMEDQLKDWIRDVGDKIKDVDYPIKRPRGFNF